MAWLSLTPRTWTKTLLKLLRPRYQHQEQPPTSVVIRSVNPALGITQLKGYRWPADATAHARLNSFTIPASSASALNRT